MFLPLFCEEDWPPYSATWPISGSMQSGMCSPLPTSVPPICASGCSSWPTVAVSDSRSSARLTTTTGVMHAGRSLTDDIRAWNTLRATEGEGGPRCPDGKRSLGLNDRQTSIGDGHQVTIAEQAEHWPTPTARDYKDGTADACANVPVNSLLGRFAPLWATPNVPNGGRMVDDETVTAKGTRADGSKAQIDLSSQVRLWATPRAEDSEQCGNHPGAQDSLTGQTRLWQTPQTDSFRSRSGDRINEQGLDQQTRLWKTPHGIANTDRFGKTGGGGGEFRAQTNSWPTPTAEPYGSSQNGSNGIGGAHERPSANTPSLERRSRSFLPLLATSTPGDDCSPSDPTSRPHWSTPRADGNRTSPRALTERTDGGGGTAALSLEQQALGRVLISQAKAKLNPRFVEFLMGLPIGWTTVSIDSARAAMLWSRWRRRSRFALWQLLQDSGILISGGTNHGVLHDERDRDADSMVREMRIHVGAGR